MSAPETAPVPRFTFKKKLQFEARCRAQLTVSSVLPEVPSNGVRRNIRKARSNFEFSNGPPPPPPFVTLFGKDRVNPAQLVARDQAAARGVYCPPSDFSFRGEDSERHVGGKFVTKFHRPSNQTQRRNMAINQANFFESDEELTPGQKSAMRASMGDDREPFVLQMPNTSSKWANTELRIDIAREQAGLFTGPYTGDTFESYQSTTKLIKPHPKTHSIVGKRFELLSASERLAKTQNSREIQAAQVPLALLNPIMPTSSSSSTSLLSTTKSHKTLAADASPSKNRAIVSRESCEGPISIGGL